MTDAYHATCNAIRRIPNDGTLDTVHDIVTALSSDGATAQAIARECAGVCAMLLAKNAAYSDSATNPLRVFSKASPEEQILVRIDDKLSRLARGSQAGEDTVLDLIGYLILLRVVRRADRG